MAYIGNKKNNSSKNFAGVDKINEKKKQRFYKKKWFKILFFFLLILFFVGGFFMWKTGSVLNKISDGGFIKTLVHNIPGIEKKLEGEEDGRINILLLGIRGVNLPGGGNLSDTIILFSVKPQENKISMISIPRDLYVTVPETQSKQKINAVHHYGEEKEEGKGLEYMKEVVGEVTGLPIHYSGRIDFAGFENLIDAIGGVEINLEKPFEEPIQFNKPEVCDGDNGGVFTVPTGKYQYKKNEKGKIVAQYPLCTNRNTECGGVFKLPAGNQILDGEKALCYVRSRETSSDFQRARRQQEIIQLVKDKMFSIGTLTDFSKVSKIFDALGNNVKVDMELWEMQRLYEIYKEMPETKIYQKVLENTEEGLLYHPGEGAAGYILLPRGDNYERIHEMARNIFNDVSQGE
jgi:polyisoprenyl-teichoic acid--peptidoglycan teichoic acid transferase